MTKSQTFAKWVFLIAGIYGILVLAPQYFLEARLNQEYPPAITHPEHFYGFIGVALAWQFVFLMISRDVARYRLLMLPSILEKATFGIAVIVLFTMGRVQAPILAAGLTDLLLGTLFTAAYLATRD